MKSFAIIVAVLVPSWMAAASAPGHAGGLHRVTQINDSAVDFGSGSFYGSFAAVAGGMTYFVAAEPHAGSEVWRTDGTEAGTTLVADIRPGAESSYPYEFTELNGTIFFVLDDYDPATVGLWKTDGRPARTEQLLRLPAGELCKARGRLLFTARDEVHGEELWRSNGTAGGTILVKDISPGSAGSRPSSKTEINGKLFFTADDGVHGRELWKSDGTSAGTVLVKDLSPGSAGSELAALTKVGNRLYFVARGNELWKSDGTERGTVLVSMLSSGTPDALTNVNGVLFFVSGGGLWKSDGTGAGTVLVKDFSPDQLSFPFLTSVRGTLYFVADDGVHGRELWRSDGTGAGTVLVKDINPGAEQSYPGWLISVDGTLYFAASDGIHGLEIWKSDGTTAGTELVRDILPGAGHGFSAGGGLTLDAQGRLFFFADDGVHGSEPWTSDGTNAGTTLLANVCTGDASSYPYDLTDVEGQLFFVAHDGAHGDELWKSDGSAAGTVLVRDINPGTGGNSAGWLTNVGGTLFFAASATGGFETGLWKSDGTEAGTVRVQQDLLSRARNVRDLTNVDGTVFFSANWIQFGNGSVTQYGVELWKSDGTDAGTVMVRDIQPGALSGRPYELTDVGGVLLFGADDGIHGMELWKSDGTEAGTALLADINPGSQRSDPVGFTNVGGTLYFLANDGVHGQELWKSDGTDAGTVMVRDIRPGPDWAGFASIPTQAGGTVFFSVDDGTHGIELWKSDGTEAGTVMVADIRPGPASSDATQLVNVDGSLLFAADDGIHGVELWKSDGTRAGTVLVRDISRGAASSGPQLSGDPYTSEPGSSAISLGFLYFVATDGVHGRELWKTDGTKRGTTMVQDIARGRWDSFPGAPAVAGSRLFLRADDSVLGEPTDYELWVIEPRGSRDRGPEPDEVTTGAEATLADAE